MKIAVVGSKGLLIPDLSKYIPADTTEIVSGGANETDTCAREYALTHGILLTEFLPKYNIYGKAAPLKRNIQMIEYSDLVIAFWDGENCDTKHVIDNCYERKIPLYLFMFI